MARSVAATDVFFAEAHEEDVQARDKRGMTAERRFYFIGTCTKPGDPFWLMALR
jgi:hypothetical protein